MRQYRQSVATEGKWSLARCCMRSHAVRSVCGLYCFRMSHIILAAVRYDLPLRSALMHLYQYFHITAVERCSPPSSSHHRDRIGGRSQTLQLCEGSEARPCGRHLTVPYPPRFDSITNERTYHIRTIPIFQVHLFGAIDLQAHHVYHLAMSRDGRVKRNVATYGSHPFSFFLCPPAKITNVMQLGRKSLYLPYHRYLALQTTWDSTPTVT